MKKIIIAIFFGLLLLLMPCASAFQMPLTNDDKTELNNLIKNQDKDVEDTFENIINEDNSLDIDELENILKNCYLNEDFSILQTDPWDWIVERLGWIYITLDNVMNLYYSGLNIYYELLEGMQVAQDWFNSITALRAAWQAFKADPLNFQSITNLVTAVIDLLQDTINLLDYVMNQELIDALTSFVDEVNAFVDFLNSDPWAGPITIYGEVSGVTESVTITTKSDSVSTTGEYEVSYTTADTSLPWFVHKVGIGASYKGKNIGKDRYAFSMGSIELNLDESDFQSRSVNKALFNVLSINPFLLLLLVKLLNLRN